MRSHTLRALFVLILAAQWSPVLAGQGTPVAFVLDELRAGNGADVLVVLESGVSRLDLPPGVELLRDYRSLEVASVRIHSERALRELLRVPRVRHIVSDRKYPLQASFSLPLIEEPEVQAWGWRGGG